MLQICSVKFMENSDLFLVSGSPIMEESSSGMYPHLRCTDHKLDPIVPRPAPRNFGAGGEFSTKLRWIFRQFSVKFTVYFSEIFFYGSTFLVTKNSQQNDWILVLSQDRVLQNVQKFRWNFTGTTVRRGDVGYDMVDAMLFGLENVLNRNCDNLPYNFTDEHLYNLLKWVFSYDISIVTMRYLTQILRQKWYYQRCRIKIYDIIVRDHDVMKFFHHQAVTSCWCHIWYHENWQKTAKAEPNSPSWLTHQKYFLFWEIHLDCRYSDYFTSYWVIED